MLRRIIKKGMKIDNKIDIRNLAYCKNSIEENERQVVLFDKFCHVKTKVTDIAREQ